MTTALTIPEMSIMDLGKVLAESGYFQDARQADQAVVKVLAGRELGFGPIASMRNIKISKNGSIILAAELQASAVRKSGIYDYEVDKLDDTECALSFYCKSARTGAWKKLGESRFTQGDMERAEAGKLIAPGASKSMAARFPRNMLFARAISNGVKWYCPDVTNGISIYTAEELGEVVDGEANPIILRDPGPTWIEEPATDPTPAPSPSQPDRDLCIPRSSQPAPESPKPEPQNGGKFKSAKLTGPIIESFGIWCGEWVKDARASKYSHEGGGPNMYHILGRIAKLGFAEVTAENFEAVKAKLQEHIEKEAK